MCAGKGTVERTACPSSTQVNNADAWGREGVLLNLVGGNVCYGEACSIDTARRHNKDGAAPVGKALRSDTHTHGAPSRA